MRDPTPKGQRDLCDFSTQWTSETQSCEDLGVNAYMYHRSKLKDLNCSSSVTFYFALLDDLLSRYI